MRRICAGLALTTLFLGCELNPADDDPIGEQGGTGGQSGSGNGGTAGKAAGSGGSSGAVSSGGTSGTGGGKAGQGGVGGSASGGKGGSSGAAAGGSNAGSGGATAGKGGAGGSSGGGKGGFGGKAAGGAGSGGSTAGSSTAGSSVGGSGSCVENLGCELAAPATTGDPAQDCVNRINQFRAECACLPPLERWTDGEACADQMAEYDSEDGSAHAGFRDDICEGGSAQNECPGWGSVNQVVSGCLQQMWNEGPPPDPECDGDCFQMYGHFINMTNDAYNKVACGFFETDEGEFWAVQNYSR